MKMRQKCQLYQLTTLMMHPLIIIVLTNIIKIGKSGFLFTAQFLSVSNLVSAIYLIYNRFF